jgi:hypothetical protein
MRKARFERASFLSKRAFLTGPLGVTPLTRGFGQQVTAALLAISLAVRGVVAAIIFTVMNVSE